VVLPLIGVESPQAKKAMIGDLSGRPPSHLSSRAA
jgi:hypothetical protein